MRLRRAALRAAAMVCAAGLVLSGCSGKSPLDPKNPVAVEVWHYYNGQQKIAFDDLVTKFNESVGLEKGITVTAFSQGNVTDLTGKVIDSANKKVGAQEIPEIFAAYADTAYQVDQLGLVAKLDGFLSPQELEEYIPGYIEEGRFDSEEALKIFPVAKSTEVMMLNKTDWDTFAQATGAELSALKTMEGLTDTARRYYEWTDSLTPAPDDGRAFFGRDAMANYFIVGCKQLGSEIFSSKGGSVTLNLDEAVLRRVWEQFYIPYVNGWFTAQGRFRSDDAKTGALIALVGSTTGAAYFPDRVTLSDTESYPIESIVLEPPCFEGALPVAVQQGAGMVVKKSTEQKEYASVEFLKWFTDSARNIDFSASSGYLPVKKEANDIALVKKSLEAVGEVSASLVASLEVSLQLTATHEMYTSKAFQGGTEARDILETSLLNRAKADRESALGNMKAGKPHDEVIAAFTTDASFQSWLQDFTAAIKSAAGV